MNDLTFTNFELAKIAKAVNRHIEHLINNFIEDDDLYLFTIRDYINLYEKVADYANDLEEMI